MICDEEARVITFANRQLGTGDFISIDGREGAIYEGSMNLQTT
jgi:phosphohistidine swiveling domain-containing protein